MNRALIQDFIKDFARKHNLGLGWASISSINPSIRNCALNLSGYKVSLVTFVEFNDFDFLEHQVMFQVRAMMNKQPEMSGKLPFSKIQVPSRVGYKLIAISAKTASNINSYLYAGLVIVPSVPLLDCIIEHGIVQDSPDEMIIDFHQATVSGERVIRVSCQYVFNEDGCVKNPIESATWMGLLHSSRDFHMNPNNRSIWNLINVSRKPRYDGYSVLIDSENRLYYESGGEWHRYLVHAIEKVELPEHALNELQMKNMMEALQ